MKIDVASINSGLEAGEFYLEYLPTMKLANGRCVGGEALARWRRPDGLVMPDDFIPVLENTPLSGIFTYWVIETVARELGELMRGQDDFFIGVNVPPEILGRGGLAYAIQKSGLQDCAAKLVLEVTERGLPDQLGVDALNLAHEAGYRVALDDAMLGGGNLVVLSRIATIDMVKIDKAYVDRLTADSDLWPSLAALTGSCPATVVAEGVSTAVQAAALHHAGVELGQGFFYSPPLSADDFRKFFLAHR